MRFAYADPPYLGCGRLYAAHHPDALAWDDPETHRALIARLVDEYPDGWALSLTSTSLRTLLPMCPEDVRVGAWVKPFASFKPGINPAYAWEPVVWRGGRTAQEHGGKVVPTVRDWLAERITLEAGLAGAKPPAFVLWMLDLLGARPGDEVVDLFPGTGIVGRVWDALCGEGRIDELPLFDDGSAA